MSTGRAVGASSAADLSAWPGPGLFRLRHRPRRRRIVIRFIVRPVNNDRVSERRQSLLRKSILAGFVARMRGLHGLFQFTSLHYSAVTHVHTLTFIDSRPSGTDARLRLYSQRPFVHSSRQTPFTAPQVTKRIRYGVPRALCSKHIELFSCIAPRKVNQFRRKRQSP